MTMPILDKQFMAGTKIKLVGYYTNTGVNL